MPLLTLVGYVGWLVLALMAGLGVAASQLDSYNREQERLQSVGPLHLLYMINGRDTNLR